MSFGNDVQQFFIEKTTRKARTKPVLPKEKIISRWLFVLMFVTMIGGSTLSCVLAVLVSPWLFLSIPLFVSAGFLIAVFGDWYDAKYGL